mmetsp:Transcript_129151/g.257853  ORF Transcript_129151/g.257853 Transcript_129151/m.257853 type:complete len:369 (+) Transcript_129151:82-1188(+)
MEAALPFCLSGSALGAALGALFWQLLNATNEKQQQAGSRGGRRGGRAVIEEGGEEALCEEELLAQAKEAQTRSMGIRKKKAPKAVSDANYFLGFSMQQARQHADQMSAAMKERTPAEVLTELQKGNTRFWMGMSSTDTGNVFQRRALISKQYPCVAVLGCSDSRVPVEIVFDQGLGDLFVVRVAGNCLDTATMASLQYAVCHLKVKVLVVMGHEGCGAVKAAALPTAKIEQEPPALSQALKLLKSGLDEDLLNSIQDTRSRDREAVVTNVHAQIKGLSNNTTVMTAVHRKELIVVGAFYEISSGIVDFFFEVTEVPQGGMTPRNEADDSVGRRVSRTRFEVPSSHLDELGVRKQKEQNKGLMGFRRGR